MVCGNHTSFNGLSLEPFILTFEERFCLLMRLARPIQCQKVNSKQDPKSQRLVGNSDFLLRSVRLTRISALVWLTGGLRIMTFAHRGH